MSVNELRWKNPKHGSHAKVVDFDQCCVSVPRHTSCSSLASCPDLADSLNIPGLEHGSKLHHILQEQGDLQQLPSWLQDSPAPSIPDHLVSPIPSCKQNTSKNASYQEVLFDYNDNCAASDMTLQELSMALAALQETFLQLSPGNSSDAQDTPSPRKRLCTQFNTAAQADIGNKKLSLVS